MAASSDWEKVNISADDFSGYKPGRNLFVNFTNIFNENRMQLLAGNGSGGVQIFSADGSVPNPPVARDEFHVYPNPVGPGGSFRILSGQNVVIRIIDTIGRVIANGMTISAGSPYLIETNNLPAGVYFVIARFPDKSLKSRAIVIMP